MFISVIGSIVVIIVVEALVIGVSMWLSCG